jgi:hypothetical protein
VEVLVLGDQEGDKNLSKGGPDLNVVVQQKSKARREEVGRNFGCVEAGLLASIVLAGLDDGLETLQQCLAVLESGNILDSSRLGGGSELEGELADDVRDNVRDLVGVVDVSSKATYARRGMK